MPKNIESGKYETSLSLGSFSHIKYKNLMRRISMEDESIVALFSHEHVPSNSSVKMDKILNVIVHGLFICHIRETHIELLTPYMDEHKYVVGNWNKNELKPLQDGELYSLSGTRRFVDPPILNNHYSIVLSKSQECFSVDASKSYFVIKLPFPRSITPLRSFPGRHLLRGKTSIHSDGLSLCHALVYPIVSFKDVRLWGTDWKPNPTIHGNAKYANLHIFAEPAAPLQTGGHSMRAFNLLMEMIPPIDIQLTMDMPWPLDQPTVPGVSRDEERGLCEWIGGCAVPPLLGSAPSNCQIVFVVK
jgi:hypothetical protein